MDNKTLQHNFRQQLTNVHALTVLTVSLFEIIGYIVLILSDVESFSLQNTYLWCNVVLPIFINIITHFVARGIVSNPSVNSLKKNRTIITAALITSLVVAVIHKEYIVTSCAFIFPMMLSAMFNDRKLLNTSFKFSVLILSCVGVAFWLDKDMTLLSALNLFVLFGFAWISYLCGIISINFSKQNYTTIETQAEQNSKLMDTVLKDQMTGLYDHNAFISQLDEMIVDYSPNEPICLVMVDVDDFKKVNDTFGHDCGDMVLIHLAEILSNYCGEGGTAYRYGGEEFAIIFKGKSEVTVCDIMQNILSKFSGYAFPFTDTPITFSAGIASFETNTTRDVFFEQADKTLYFAKHEGKNRILTAKQSINL